MRRALCLCLASRTEHGNVGDLLTMGMFVIGMSVVMISFLDCSELIHRKSEVSQLAREYLLRMETVGYLTVQDERALSDRLSSLGVTGIDFGATTRSEVGYGQVITLEIRGTLEDQYDIREIRTSTAKH